MFVSQHVVPKYIYLRINKIKLKSSKTIDKAFCNDDISKTELQLNKFKFIWNSVMKNLCD